MYRKLTVAALGRVQGIWPVLERLSTQRRVYLALVLLSLILSLWATVLLLADWDKRPNQTLYIAVKAAKHSEPWRVDYVHVVLWGNPIHWSGRTSMVVTPHLINAIGNDVVSVAYQLQLIVSGSPDCYFTDQSDGKSQRRQIVPQQVSGSDAGYIINIRPADPAYFTCDADASVSQDFIRRSILVSYGSTIADKVGLSELDPDFVPVLVDPSPFWIAEDDPKVIGGDTSLPPNRIAAWNEGTRLMSRSSYYNAIRYLWKDEQYGRIKDTMLLVVGGFFGLLCSVLLEMSERMGKQTA